MPRLQESERRCWASSAHKFLLGETMFRKHISASVLLMLLAATAVAQADKTDDFIKAEIKRQNIPGLSLAVVKDGEIIKAEGYGLANVKLKIPARPETVYKIASVSKQFIFHLLHRDAKLRGPLTLFSHRRHEIT
ncbi:MAG: serine hydrolase [Blastocatellia bacterium]